jgi:hypothetical protein
MSPPRTLDLEDLVIATYAALDDALTGAGVPCQDGKLVPRSGPAPDVDDREVLCLAVLQELLGFEADCEFQAWLRANETIRKLFPRLLSRQNFAGRRALLTPLLAALCWAFCGLDDEADPPFRLSIPTPSMSAGRFAPGKKNGSADWLGAAIAPRSNAGSTACAST